VGAAITGTVTLLSYEVFPSVIKRARPAALCMWGSIDGASSMACTAHKHIIESEANLTRFSNEECLELCIQMSLLLFYPPTESLLWNQNMTYPFWICGSNIQC
jgi:hypothetical protein